MLMGVEVDGKDVCPTCVMGKEAPLPTVMRVGVETRVADMRLPR